MSDPKPALTRDLHASIPTTSSSGGESGSSAQHPLAKAEYQTLGNKYRRFVHVWPTTNTPWCVICFIHGLGDHGGRYQAVARYMNQHGIAAVALDQAGHGRSPGWRGCIDSYESVLDEVERTLDLAQQYWPGVPPVLYGQSMGGNLVLNYLLRRKSLPAAAISTAPMLRAGQPPSEQFLKIARVLARCLPHFQMSAPIRVEYLSRDPIAQRNYLQDRLMHSKLSLRLGAALIDTGVWAIENASKLQTPTLLMHGDADQLTSPQGSIDFGKNTNSSCTLKIWKEYRHDLHLEVGSDAVMQYTLDWLKSLDFANAHHPAQLYADRVNLR